MDYLHPGPDCVDGQVQDQAESLGDGGQKKWKVQLHRRMVVVLLQEGRNCPHPPVVHEHIHEGGDEGGRECQLDALEQLEALVAQALLEEHIGVVVLELAGFEAGGDGVNGVQNGVADPVAEG